MIVEVRVPDLGEVEAVDVVEVLVEPGASVAVDDGLATLESDKASMDIPSPHAGTVREIALKKGDKIKEGDLVLTLEVVEAAAEGAGQPAGGEEAARTAAGSDRAAAPAGEKTGEAAETAAAPAADARQEAGAEGGAVEAALPAGREGASRAADPAAPPAAAATASPSAAQRVAARPLPAAPLATRQAADLHAEVLVLGAGPGGYTAAFRAADLGRKVVLVERYPDLGGVCLNVGCIPSKALLHVARVIEEAADLREHGVAFGKPKLDLDKLRAWKDSVVGRLTGGLATMAKKRQVEVVRGTGRFASPHTLAVDTADGERTISFDAAVIAVGSRVAELPGVPEDPRVMDSTGALALEEVPKRLLLVGGGIIGLEMAMVYGALGAKLTVVELLDGLIPGCDRDLVRPLERRLKKRLGAAIHLETRVTEIKPQKRGLKAFFQGEGAPASATFDRVLVAVGRKPNGATIGADAAGVHVDERGFIPVDRQQRTNVAHIFAIGDVVGDPMLAHKASHEGKVAAEVAAGEPSSFDARVIPSVAYTDPEIAWVGLTETEAKRDGTPYERAAFPWGASGRALGMGRDDGLTKILFDPATKRVLGAGIVGPGAGDLISELALAIEMDCEAADLGLTVHPHPTLSETVAFAAEIFEGTVTDLYLPKKKR